jgi:hypothetical protein
LALPAATEIEAQVATEWASRARCLALLPKHLCYM